MFVFQVDFIDSICLPVYDAFASLNPALSPLRDNCISNKQEWTELAQKEEDLWEKKEWVKNTMTCNTSKGGWFKQFWGAFGRAVDGNFKSLKLQPKWMRTRHFYLAPMQNKQLIHNTHLEAPLCPVATALHLINIVKHFTNVKT